jgi:hypothetical protein
MHEAVNSCVSSFALSFCQTAAKSPDLPTARSVAEHELSAATIDDHIELFAKSCHNCEVGYLGFVTSITVNRDDFVDGGIISSVAPKVTRLPTDVVDLFNVSSCMEVPSFPDSVH